MVWLFSVTLFLSAGLMFIVEPMIGKMLLPLVGGAPAVWNTCMMFFQGVLLLGYGYVHVTTQRLNVHRQRVLHVLIMVLPFLVLPIHIADGTLATMPTHTSPVPWLLGFLALAVGLPVFVFSTTAPLLQRWFTTTNHTDAHDPYFLYAASNAGSLFGLLSYPVLIEPRLSLERQNQLVAIGYTALALLVVVCASKIQISTISATVSKPATISAPWRQRLRWTILAFVPSSLMLGVTTYITTDVAPFPLLWVLPLALYLGTFILTFGRRPVRLPAWMGRVLCLPVVVLIVAFIVEATHPAWLMVLLHLLVFVVAAMLCHGTLAQDRPGPAQLTDFYLWLSVGGVLGGVFNALVAPQIFRTVLEYPLVMALACALRPTQTPRGASLWQDAGWATGVGALTAGTVLIAQHFGFGATQFGTLVMFAAPALLTYRWVQHPARFGMCLIAMLVAGTLHGSVHGRTLAVERNFFGVLRVTIDPASRYHQLVHGNTLHGRQSVAPSRRLEPLAYYHRTGPVGDIFSMIQHQPSVTNVAVIGLGAGALLCYAEPTQHWTFYEIDPAVETVARDPRLFTFLPDNRARSTAVTLGDARLQLRYAPDHAYELLVLDAFSSDAIPLHLLTREALQLYLAKLADHGLLVVHISNRRLDLQPVLANLARDARLLCLSREGPEVATDDAVTARWVIITRHHDNLGELATDPRWQPLRPDEHLGVWTDDFSNILAVLKWR